MDKSRTRAILLLTIVGSGIIYQLPYLRNIFYMPMIEAFNLNHFQLGVLSSAYAAVSMLSYFFGGLIVMRVGWEKLLGTAFLSTGVVGIAMSFATSYPQLLALFSFLGITTVLPYFSPVMCVNNTLFSAPGNSRLKRYLNVGRGITSAVLGGFCVLIFVLLGCSAVGLQIVILIYSMTALVFGVILLVAMPQFEQKNPQVDFFTFSHLRKLFYILKKPLFQKWCVQIAVSYSIYIFMGCCIPLLVLRYQTSVEISLALGILRYVCSALAVVLAVCLNSREINKQHLMFWGYLICAVCMLILLVLPTSLLVIPVIIAVFLALCICVYACREFYFSLYTDSEFVPGQYGLVIGLVAFLSYLPEIFLNPLIGYWIDHGGAFEAIFISGVGFCCVGLIICKFLGKQTAKTK